MTNRWPELLSLTEQSRKAFFERLPPQGTGLSVGEVHLLAVCTLATAGYVMVRGVEPVANGQLDAGLAAMFRLIDGVRLVTTEMMRATAGEHGCDRPVGAQGIADYAERYAVYYGTHGVCAGPQALIDEYLQVLLEGASAPIQVEPHMATRVGDLDAALDYGLSGQRIEALIRIFGAAQGLLHERLAAAVRPLTAGTKLGELLEIPVDSEHYPLLRMDHPPKETFELELAINRWLYDRTRGRVTGDTIGAPDEVLALQAIEPAVKAEQKSRLREFFGRALPDGALSEAAASEVAAVAADVFTLERQCLRAVAGEQGRLNERLCRPNGRPLTGDDLAVYTRPRMGPPLAATLAEGLGLSITTDAAATLLPSGGQTLSLTD
jgi:hypothetical protein